MRGDQGGWNYVHGSPKIPFNTSSRHYLTARNGIVKLDEYARGEEARQDPKKWWGSQGGPGFTPNQQGAQDKTCGKIELLGEYTADVDEQGHSKRDEWAKLKQEKWHEWRDAALHVQQWARRQGFEFGIFVWRARFNLYFRQCTVLGAGAAAGGDDASGASGGGGDGTFARPAKRTVPYNDNTLEELQKQMAAAGGGGDASGGGGGGTVPYNDDNTLEEQMAAAAGGGDASGGGGGGGGTFARPAKRARTVPYNNTLEELQKQMADQQRQITEQQITEQQRQITEQQRQITEQQRQITEQQRQITELYDRMEARRCVK